MDRKQEQTEFIKKMGELIAIAKPNLVSCEYIETDTQEICRVNCRNGYFYDINISGNSLMATLDDVTRKMVCK